MVYCQQGLLVVRGVTSYAKQLLCQLGNFVEFYPQFYKMVKGINKLLAYFPPVKICTIKGDASLPVSRLISLPVP